MRMFYVLWVLMAAFSVPAAADLKQEVEKVASAYAESFRIVKASLHSTQLVAYSLIQRGHERILRSC